MHADDDEEVEYVMNAAFPEMPPSVPLTYTLTVHACLSATPSERPSISQVLPLLGAAIFRIYLP